jgi:hypothetical protein
MRHIASWRDGDTVQYAIVDEETGELNQFARIQVPEHFDFEASALLGTNLASVLGLDRNGTKPRAKPVVAPPTAVAQPKAQAPRQRQPGRRANPGREPGEGRRYITDDEVLAAIAAHPDGASGAMITETVWGEADYPAWLRKSIDNRIGRWVTANREHGDPLPFIVEMRPNKRQQPSRWLTPLPG